MTVEVRVTNIDEIQRFMGRWGPMAREVSLDAATDMVLDAERFAKEQARGREERPFLRTGNYLNSIHNVIRKTDKQMTGAIRSNVRYARYLEEGTRPHVIRPRKKKALYWPGALHPVKKVNHPGTPAYRVLGNAADRVLRDLAKYVRRAWEKLEQRMARRG